MARWGRIGLAVAVAALALGLLGRVAGAALPGFAERVGGLGAWGPAAFVVGYAVATVGLLPGSLLTLAAGALFGIARGVLYALLGAVLGSAAAFLVARHLARPVVERRLLGDARFQRIDRAIGREGLRVVVLLRLSPVLPFNALNYALGLTRVRFRDYLVGSVGMLPGTLLYVYYGKVAGDVAALAAGVEVGRGAGYYLVLGLGLVATLALTLLVARLARRALQEETDDAAARAR